MLPEENAHEKLSTIKHDIKNQLSNVYFAIDQLRYELEKAEAGSFAMFCVDTIANSCADINMQLEKIT